MKPLRVLFIVSELAPFTGESARAKEHRFLSRALAEIGIDVTIALSGANVPVHARTSLARRLSPYVITDSADTEDTRELLVYEGSAGDSRVGVLVLDGLDTDTDTDTDTGAAGDADESDRQTQRALCRAALSVLADRDAYPDVVITAHGSEAVLAEIAAMASTEDSLAPATVFLLRDPSAPGVTSALAHADRVVVPSAAYARALKDSIDRGYRDPVSRLLADVRDIVAGVASGIDSIEWNPHQDGLLDRDFPRDPRAGKAAHKARLCDRLRLRPKDADVPLIAIIGPIDPNILGYGTVNALAQVASRFVVVADPTSDTTSLRHLERAANQNPQRIALQRFTDAHERRAFEHDLLAAADLCLIPHDFSPGGLCDLHALHYGTIPIAPRTGWYDDYLVEFDRLSATGSGFLYQPYNSDHLLDTVQRALHAYARKDTFAQLIERVMTMDLSWRTAGQRYTNILVELMRERRADVLAS